MNSLNWFTRKNDPSSISISISPFWSNTSRSPIWIGRLTSTVVHPVLPLS